MLKTKALRKVLEQSLTGGVQGAILFDSQGSMIAFAGNDLNTSQMVSAIVANIWSSYESKEPSLEVLLFDFEKGRIAATRSSSFVLCVYGESVPMGMLKNKTSSLAEYLAPSLEQVMAAQ